MRIADSALIGDFLSSINRSRSRIDRLTAQLATQQRILRASDDPAGSSTLLRVDADLERVKAFQATVSNGKGLLSATTESLGRMADVLGDVTSLLSSSLSVQDPAMRGELADQVDQFLALGVDVANTRYDGKYLFGGTQTTTTPFALGSDATHYAYRGDAQSIQYRVGEGISQVVSISGSAAFGSTGEINLTGVIDRNAAVPTTVTSTMQVADSAGVMHDVVLTLRKTDAHTWTMSAALPPGTTGATLTGGTTVLRFDPVTGEAEHIQRGAPLVLTTPGANPDAPEASVNILVRAGALEEADTGEGLSILGGQYEAVSVFDHLVAIRERLRSGQSLTADDTALLGMMQDVVTQEASRAALYATNLGIADDALSARSERLFDLRSATQDVDLVEIGLKLKQEQLTLEATLSAAANIIPKSLLDFLR